MFDIKINNMRKGKCMKRIMTLLLVTVFVVLTLCGCKENRPYDEKDFIGLTSAEIIEKYGEFDNVRMPPDEDGLYRRCRCGYIVKEKQVGFWGTTPPEMFMIYFNDQGIAYKCAYETGGIGG